MTNNSPFLSQSPVRYLREIQADGSELFVGDIGFIRCPDIPFENPKHDNETNLKLPTGDPNIVWTIGGLYNESSHTLYLTSQSSIDWVTPSHQRKGIMTDAVDTLINEIAKPLMGARHLTASTYTANEGSKKVFLKNGFSVVQCIENYAEVKGYQRDLIIMERHDD
jgi:RimJ/RimL family protein N-acetyltransferase